MNRIFVLISCALFSFSVFAGHKAFRKPATYDIDTKTAAERAAKAICEVSFGDGCAAGNAVCKDTSMDETTSTQVCKVVIKTVKSTKVPGSLDYKIEILNGRVNSVVEHCGMCD